MDAPIKNPRDQFTLTTRVFGFARFWCSRASGRASTGV